MLSSGFHSGVGEGAGVASGPGVAVGAGEIVDAGIGVAVGRTGTVGDTAIASGGKEGMISMDQALLELYRDGVITKETALEYAEAPDTIRRQLN